MKFILLLLAAFCRAAQLVKSLSSLPIKRSLQLMVCYIPIAVSPLGFCAQRPIQWAKTSPPLLELYENDRSLGRLAYIELVVDKFELTCLVRMPALPSCDKHVIFRL